MVELGLQVKSLSLSVFFFFFFLLEWVAIPFFRGSSWPRDCIRSPALQTGSLPSEPPGKHWIHSTSNKMIKLLFKMKILISGSWKKCPLSLTMMLFVTFPLTISFCRCASQSLALIQSRISFWNNSSQNFDLV